jgi:hypothetical protein
MVVLLTNSEAMTTNSAHGITVRISHSMCRMDRIKGMAGLLTVGCYLVGRAARSDCFKRRFQGVLAIWRKQDGR